MPFVVFFAYRLPACPKRGDNHQMVKTISIPTATKRESLRCKDSHIAPRRTKRGGSDGELPFRSHSRQTIPPPHLWKETESFPPNRHAQMLSAPRAVHTTGLTRRAPNIATERDTGKREPPAERRRLEIGAGMPPDCLGHR